ncbi:MAG: hypothetical protein KKG47_06985 [Proteobacteria bacterium]|nr:hypothetical protein [Pseudomonadota bacterium]MBU1739150.1 hypothetical protein [Pseudomonadota bacterium]
MIRALLAILLIGFLVGCSRLTVSSVGPEQLLPVERSLWQLNIGSRQNPQFTGLLALRISGSGIEAVVLDSTGIKLLAEKIGPDGEIEVQTALPVIREKGLPAFLGTGLHRIFQSAAGKTSVPCRQEFLLQRCFGEKSNGRLIKSVGFGPFELWSVEYLINKERTEPGVSGAVLDSGWFIPLLRLERK